MDMRANPVRSMGNRKRKTLLKQRNSSRQHVNTGTRQVDVANQFYISKSAVSMIMKNWRTVKRKQVANTI